MNAKFDMLNAMHHLPGCNRITRQYQVLMKSNNLELWAEEFKSNKSRFEESQGDFTKENLMLLFKKIYEEKCGDSWDPLFENFLHIMNCRKGNQF